MAQPDGLYMEFREFRIPWGPEVRKLGILGEVHQYTTKESEFALDLVQRYDVVISEIPHMGCLLGCAGLLMLPVVYLAMAKESRGKVPTIRDYAKHLGKEIVPLERGYSIPLERQAALAGMGCGSLLALLVLAITKSDVTTYINPDKAKPGTRDPILSYGVDAHYRDEVMAYRLAEQLHRDSRPTLAVCGQGHLEGLVRNLIEKQKLPLQEVSRQVV